MFFVAFQNMLESAFLHSIVSKNIKRRNNRTAIEILKNVAVEAAHSKMKRNSKKSNIMTLSFTTPLTFSLEIYKKILGT